ncbi:hypothetical protein KP509_12G014800 [Ceratopteris richardii]|nr:hypothetical protein KP509_12G014800 [Ceratopteris richardii]
MLFFLIATVNAVVLAFLGSVASVGAFAMAFFVSLIFIYSGAILVAAMSISTVTSLCICGALAVAGWIGVFWFILQGLKMTVEKLRGLCCFSVPPLTTVECRVAPTLTVESKVSEIECTRVCQTSNNNI